MATMHHVVAPKKQLLNFLSGSVYDSNTVNFWLQKINPLWSTHEMLGQIVKKQSIADDMVSLTIHCNQRMQFGIAGQHHPVHVEIQGRRYERTYSLTQLDEHHVQLTLKKIQGGIVSTWLCEQAQIGDVIEFEAPYGDMLLTTQNQKKVLLLAAGSGITPMYSMLEGLHRSGHLKDYDIHLMYWAQHATGLAFKTQFEAWQNSYPNFKFTALCTRDEPAAERINEKHTQYAADFTERSVFACGPSGFVNTAERVFSGAKLFRAEAFSLTPIQTNDIGVVNITLTKSNKIVTVAKGQPILVGLEQAQLKPTHGCRMGICNKCLCTKVSGATKNLNDQSENTEPHSLLRLCVNSAQTDLVLDL